MPEIIAETYELSKQIGAGGGGIVYLGQHLRLGKTVVLKADKRKLSTRPEVLRREVDALKNLSHTYIPQVYDFVSENDTVYTVMDYIEGESLDKPLKRKERFPQSRIITWACQLLEALQYLHSRPPHGILHSDIKPANIMLTPEGDIRLIDFNIALALGEEGTVRVGFSRGYASPEHYGVDYSSGGMTPMPQDTVLLNSSTGSSTSAKREVLLDVRSDIYSLGASLYHLLTGERPADDAKNVKPITAGPGISGAVASIIRKSMDPDPDLRYQTAAEMLYDFEHLHENDPRTKRHKRHISIAIASLATLFLVGGISTFVGLKQIEQVQAAARLAAETAEAALDAVTSSENAYAQGDIPGAIESARRAVQLESPYRGRGQKALTDALGVYNLNDGFQAHRTLTLPSEPIKLALSTTGIHTAVLTSGQVTLFTTDSGEQLAQLPADPSALTDLVFLNDQVLLYGGQGGLRAYDLAQGRELWAGEPATSIALSGDGSTAAALYRDETFAFLYDTSSGEEIGRVDFSGKHQWVASNDILLDPEDNLFALDQTGNWLAVSFDDGSLYLFDLRSPGESVKVCDPSDYIHFEGGFSGSYFAFSATKEGESVFSILDLDKLAWVGDFSSDGHIRVNVMEGNIYLSSKNILERLDPETGEEFETAYTRQDIQGFALSGGYAMVATSDSSIAFFDGEANLLVEHSSGEPCDLIQLAGEFALAASYNTPSVRVLKLENYQDYQVFSYDPAYSHSETRINADRSTVMLFQYDGFRLFSADGTQIADVAIPDAGEVYDQQYRRIEEGSFLDVIYNDGLVRRYSAEDGSLVSEQPGEAPDGSLEDEFLTDQWRITSPLHGTPAVYDKNTGELIRELESDAFLTYVTQVEQYVMTEYINTQGERYGLLLDENCETLAYLPNLCDILPNGTLLFDDTRGNLRQSHIYSLSELLELAQS